MNKIRCRTCGWALRPEAEERRACFACQPMSRQEEEEFLHPDLKKFRKESKGGFSKS